MELLLGFPLLNEIYVKMWMKSWNQMHAFFFLNLFEKYYQSINELQPQLVLLSSHQILNKAILLIFLSIFLSGIDCHATQKQMAPCLRRNLKLSRMWFRIKNLNVILEYSSGYFAMFYILVFQRPCTL